MSDVKEGGRAQPAPVKSIHATTLGIPAVSPEALVTPRPEEAPPAPAPRVEEEDAFSARRTCRLPVERTLPPAARAIFARLDGTHLVPDRDLGPPQAAGVEAPVTPPMLSWWPRVIVTALALAAVALVLTIVLRVAFHTSR